MLFNGHECKFFSFQEGKLKEWLSMKKDRELLEPLGNYQNNGFVMQFRIIELDFQFMRISGRRDQTLSQFSMQIMCEDSMGF
jgi:hypothetical protein